MNVRDCYKELGLSPGAGMEDVKTAYRKLAFRLHPDVNKNDPNAAGRFQRLNEAYVILRKALEEESTFEKTRSKKTDARSSAGPDPSAKVQRPKEEDVLKTILKDPFAKKDFEDIYTHVRSEPGEKAGRTSQTAAPGRRNASQQASATHQSKASPSFGKQRHMSVRWGDKEVQVDVAGSMRNSVFSWIKRQMDDETTVQVKAEQLIPGRILRMQVRRPWSGKAVSVELPLPPDYKPGRRLRLKGMGRSIGPFKGDLYLRLMPSS